MKLKRVLKLAAPMMLIAGAAFAANSGAASIDGAIGNVGHVVTNDLGMGMGITGFLGTSTAVRHGMHAISESSFGTMVTGAGLFNYPVLAPFFFLSPAALIHPATQAAIVHAVTRLL